MSDPYVGQSGDPGVPGLSGENSANGVGVKGQGMPGVWGEGDPAGGEGVHGLSHSTWAGVAGINNSAQGGPGVWGEGSKAGGEGVRGISHSNWAGVAGFNTSTGPAIYGESDGKGFHSAGYFKGNVTVTGDIQLANADCAEDFDLSPQDSSVDIAVSPGTVMVLDDNGALRVSSDPYDSRVAGVVSGAGDYKPGLILDRHSSSAARAPVALLGKVYCNVDADAHAIEVGDLLTTSARPGHAMKASDATQAFGAVLGKALRALSGGQGLIPVLVALQ